MLSGKKSLAQRIVYKSIEKMAEKVGKGNPIELVLGALENIRPKIEVKAEESEVRHIRYLLRYHLSVSKAWHFVGW